MSHRCNLAGAFTIYNFGGHTTSPKTRTSNPEQRSPMIPLAAVNRIISGIIYPFAHPLQLLAQTGIDRPTCCTIKRDSDDVKFFADEMSIL